MGHNRRGGRGGDDDMRDDDRGDVRVQEKAENYKKSQKSFLLQRSWLLRLLTSHPVLVGMGLRLGAAWALPLLMDGPHAVIPGVSYTDVDYSVYTDAAHLWQQGHSPYDRHTYRYTPYLAVLVAHLHAIFGPNGGRYLFCACDVLCGYLVLEFRKRQRQRKRTEQQSNSPVQSTNLHSNSNDSGTNDLYQHTLPDAVWWLYNPLAINICTRGSAEPLVALLPVLVTLWIVTSGGNGRGGSNRQGGVSCCLAVVAGLIHGVAIHAKLYPVIHTLSYAAYLAGPPPPTSKGTDRPSSSTGMTAAAQLWRWVRHLVRSPPALMFGVSSILSFAAWTLLAVAQYGSKAWEEGFAYHLSRLDHRHNYSSHWYWIYLLQGKVAAQGGPSVLARFVGPALLLPQAAFLLYTSLGLAPHNLPLALFVQTYAFVALNKVITAQYFVWHLSLLPLCADQLVWNTTTVRASLLTVLGSTGVWLLAAYTLELQNRPTHRMVWTASLIFFAAHVALLDVLTSGTKGSGSRGAGGGNKQEDVARIAASSGAGVPVHDSSTAPRWKPHVE